MRRPAAFALSLATALALLGCSDDDDGSSSGTTASTSEPATTDAPPATVSPPADRSTTTVTNELADCAPAGDSSPATFDDAAGVYAVLITAVDTDGRSLSFDVVQWLVGEDAVAAYQAETGETGGPPNDYFVANENEQTRDAPVADDVVVQLVRLTDDSDPDMDSASFDELETYAAVTPSIYWLTFDAGTVVAVCEQYTP